MHQSVRPSVLGRSVFKYLKIILTNKIVFFFFSGNNSQAGGRSRGGAIQHAQPEPAVTSGSSVPAHEQRALYGLQHVQRSVGGQCAGERTVGRRLVCV